MPGIYLHIPFCETKCIYCDFYSIETSDSHERFLTHLHDEIARQAELVTSPSPFHSIFIGGGTPSLLDERQIDGLLDALHRRFPLAPDAEITMECNPGTVHVEKLRGYRSAGVNRLSFGVQSFHEDDLRFLSRIHSVDDAEQAIRNAHTAGFANVNLDLMFSLPGQTPDRWMHNLERARALGTTHLSCYSLTVEQGTPLANMVRRGTVAMPQDESDATLFELTMDTLSEWGFRQYEVSNYALPGNECRHNLTYWRHEDYLGFGPSAHSTWNGRRWWNVSSVHAYGTAIERGALPEAGGELLTQALRREEYIYLRLRSEGIDLAEFRRLFSSDLAEDNRAFVARCLEADLLRQQGNILKLTRKGMLVCDEICAELG